MTPDSYPRFTIRNLAVGFTLVACWLCAARTNPGWTIFFAAACLSACSIVVTFYARGGIRTMMILASAVLLLAMVPLSEQPLFELIDGLTEDYARRPKLMSTVFDPIHNLTQNHCPPVWSMIRSYNESF